MTSITLDSSSRLRMLQGALGRQLKWEILILNQNQNNIHYFWPLMKFSISYPVQGTTKSFNIDDDNKCRVFFEKRMGQEVEADTLGDEFKGYIFKIDGGFDKDGFSMKQGIFSNGRIRLLLSPGAKGYRATRTGEKKRKSVRGCIVGPDISMLSVTLVKKGDKQIPGLTDETKPKRLGPKRASGVRKLYGIEKPKGDKNSATVPLIKKQIVRRTFKSKANPDAPIRNKAPKIQRLVTEVRIRRKKIQKEAKINKWKRGIEEHKAYEKVHSEWVASKKNAEKAKKTERKMSSKSEEKKEDKKEVKPTKKDTKPKAPVKEAKEKRVEVKSGKEEITGAHIKAAITKTKKVVVKKQ